MATLAELRKRAASLGINSSNAKSIGEAGKTGGVSAARNVLASTKQAPAPIQAPIQPTKAPFQGGPLDMNMGERPAGLKESSAALYGFGERKAPTIATPETPVISKTFTNELAYDANNPEDYLMRLQARGTATGKAPSETELYNAMLAQKALTSLGSAGNDAIKADADARMQEQLKAFELAQQRAFEQQKAEILAGGERQKEAGQKATSFSGFGRSTFNADQQSQIQKSTDMAINTMQAAMQSNIASERARLQAQAEQRQADAIGKAAEANQGMDYMTSINNMAITAQSAGMDIDVKAFEQAATAMKGMTDQEKEAYLANFGEQEQLLLRGLSNSLASETTGTGKNLRVWNPVTQQWEGGGSTVGSGGGGGAGAGGGSVSIGPDGEQLQEVSYNPKFSAAYNELNQGNYNALSKYAKELGINPTDLMNQAYSYKMAQLRPAVNEGIQTIENMANLYKGRMWAQRTDREGILGQRRSEDKANFDAWFDYIKENLTFNKLNELKASGATFGSLSDPERVAIGNAANSIRKNMSEDEFQRQMQTIATNLANSIGRSAPQIKIGGTDNTPQTNEKSDTQGVGGAMTIDDIFNQ